MAVFEKITLAWEGKEYVIPPDQVMRCIAQVEDVLTLGEVFECAARQQVPVAKISAAFGLILRYAGARVSDDEIYARMFNVGEQQKRALEAVNTLLLLMVPPSSYKGKAEEKKVGPANANSSQRPRSRRR